MRADSQKLYDEFLDNYGLNRALYNHAVELSKEHFIDDEIKAIQFNSPRLFDVLEKKVLSQCLKHPAQHFFHIYTFKSEFFYSSIFLVLSITLLIFTLYKSIASTIASTAP